MNKTELIKKPKPADDQMRYPDGFTPDIIETVLFADTKSAYYTADFAKTLKGKTLIDTLKNVWEFVKKNIPYKLDPAGEQWIKSPGRLWSEKAGDCKSFSIFTASCLKNLGIPYGFRFASYSKSDPTPTHVYVFVPADKNRNEIILDSVWTGPFNTQKKFEHKQDHIMSRIAYLGATTAPRPTHKPGELKLTKDISEITDGEMDLLLTRQRLEIEKMNSIGIAGPDNYQVARYDKALATINHALANIDNPAVIHGMGQQIENNGNAAVGNIFKKIGKAIGKGLKAVTKVVTLPLRLIGKGIMEIYLPKAAPMFLYLFADEKLLTDKMKAKRKKAQKFKDFVCKKLGMKDKHFMGVIRNKLTKNYKMSPEAFLAKALKQVAVKGIGYIGKAKAKAKVNKQRVKKNVRQSINVDTITAQRSQSTGLPGQDTFLQQGVDILSSYEGGGGDGGTQESSSKGKSAGSALLQAGSQLLSGNFIGAIIGAISWIIHKLGGKKSDSLTAEDIPDVAADSGNAFNNGNLQQDYSNVTPQQFQQVREVATELINNNVDPYQAQQQIQQRLPYLNRDQQTEITQQVESGFDPIDSSDAESMARQIKTGNSGFNESSGGGTGGGVCKC